MYEQFEQIGRDVFLSGLISSHAGNMSVRIGDRLVITRRGSMLGRLRPEDLIETGLFKDDSGIALASSEIVVHRAVYARTSAQAILHTHPPHGIALSLELDEIVPVDSEGSYLLHRVPVVAAEKTIGSTEMAEVLSEALSRYKLCMLRGHGLFATGHLLEEAYQWSSAFEASARVIYLVRTAGISPIEYRQESQRYSTW
ncbi:MAG: aldolase [Actinobacteria bacterium]|nr:aldolase [Actinomycetota bacterium]